MQLFGRELSRYLKAVAQVPAYAGYFVRCLRRVKRPVSFILAYLLARPVPGRVVELRNGLRLRLSDHPHDTITVFVIFIREDYGAITPGGTVVDVGANIGIFSLWAAAKGAGRVLAFEPGADAYDLLVLNARDNGLDQVIRPHRLAVVGEAGEPIRFATASSVYHSIETAGENAEWVDTTDLRRIVAESGPVDLLKLDCEGAEYAILFSGGPSEFEAIRAIRLEYHRGRRDQIDAHLARFGLRLEQAKTDSPILGNAWYARPD